MQSLKNERQTNIKMINIKVINVTVSNREIERKNDTNDEIFNLLSFSVQLYFSKVKKYRKLYVKFFISILFSAYSYETLFVR